MNSNNNKNKLFNNNYLISNRNKHIKIQIMNNNNKTYKIKDKLNNHKIKRI